MLSGLALRTVVDVQKTADGYLLKTAPAMITDAIKDGRLEGTYKIDFNRMQARKSVIRARRGFRPGSLLLVLSMPLARRRPVASGVARF